MSSIISDLVSHLQCGVAIAANDAVYISNVDGKIYKYNPLDPTQIYAGIAKEAGLLNAFIRVVQSGRVKGFTGLTPGQFVYASVTTPGGFQLTDPGAASKVVLGIAKSSTELTVNGALGIKTGGDGTGSGSLDTILQLTATEQLTDWSTGNNATVLGGGVLAGAFVKNTATPLHGSESYQYTQAAGSLNDYLVSKVFPVDVRFRGQQVYLSAPYQYNGNTGDIQIVIYCATTSTVLTTLSDTFLGTNGSTQTVIASCVIPLGCTGIRVGLQVKVLNSGKVLSFDDVQVGQSLYQAAQLNNVTDWVAASFESSTWQGLGTVLFNNLQTRRNSGSLEIRGRIDLGTVTGSTIQIPFPNNFGNGLVSAVPQSVDSYGTILKAAGAAGIYFSARAIVNASYMEVAGPLISSANNPGTSIAGTVFTTADALVFQNISIPIKGWSAGNTAIVTPTQQISSDTLPFTFKATAIVDADPIGTFNTYTYAANVNTVTISGSAPTQTVASMNADGFRIFARAFSSASTTANPARVDIKIGKGLKAEQIYAYASAAKVDPLSIDFTGLSNVELGTHVSYDELSGILRITAGVGFSNTTTRYVGLSTSSGANQTSGYFVFNASTSPSITALPIISVSALYTGAPPTGTLNSSFNITTFGTRVRDSHGAYSGGSYTVPVSGDYSISAAVGVTATFALNQDTDIAIFIDGVLAYQGYRRAGGAVTAQNPSVSVNAVPLQKGQVVTIRSASQGTSPTFSSGAALNSFSITRTGSL